MHESTDESWFCSRRLVDRQHKMKAQVTLCVELADHNSFTSVYEINNPTCFEDAVTAALQKVAEFCGDNTILNYDVLDVSFEHTRH